VVVRVCVITNKERPETSLGHGKAETFSCQSHKYVLNLFTKCGHRFRRFNGNMELIPDSGRSYRESPFANTELSGRNKRKMFGNR